MPDWRFICLDISVQNIVLLTQTAHLRVLSIQWIYPAESAMSVLPVQPQSRYQVRLWGSWL